MDVRCISRAVRCLYQQQRRTYSHAASTSKPILSPFAPRHFLSIADLTPLELTTLIRNASSHKQAHKSGCVSTSLLNSLSRKTIAMVFSKRSTRTRVSTEGAIAMMGGHPMFLGKDDIQLGVNESLRDSSIIISSMTSGIVARVGPHSDILGLAKYSSVPVINALSETAHPLQAIADFLTIHENFPSEPTLGRSPVPGLGLQGLKIAWVGDANNVLYDLARAAAKLGVTVAVATPKGYEIPQDIELQIRETADATGSANSLYTTNVPEDAIKDANIIVTDTWVSMGQEEEQVKRLKAFEGFQVTTALAERGGAAPGWKFMHCLPRHEYEVDDDVFYGPRSLVFPEGENRLWSAAAALEAFVVRNGKIQVERKGEA